VPCDASTESSDESSGEQLSSDNSIAIAKAVQRITPESLVEEISPFVSVDETDQV
jgi:hypothetical protein